MATSQPVETESAPDDGRQKWIVGYDGSDGSRHALAWAAGTAKGRSVDLEVVSAWQQPYAGVLPVPGDDIVTAGAGELQQLSNEATAVAGPIAASSGISIAARAEMGGAADVLLKAVAGADLLVVGSRGRGGFAQLVLGSVAHQTSAHSPKPVIVVPSTAEPHGLHRAIVGVDGSPNAHRALQWAHEFSPRTTELTAAHCWQTPSFAGSTLIDRRLLPDMRKRSEQDFEAEVAATAAEIGVPQRFGMAFVAGHPGEELVALARFADLLVVGARAGSGPLGGLGSLSSWVLHHLVCPTAIVPTG